MLEALTGLVVATILIIGLADLLALFLGDSLNSLFSRFGFSGVRRSRLASPAAAHAVVCKPFLPVGGTPYAEGTVLHRGELWTARCDPALAPGLAEGTKVAVSDRSGLVLTVERLREKPLVRDLPR